MAYRNKSKYTSYQQKRKYVEKVEPGMTGFLCTCNSKLKEKDCVREAYNLLNEFADKLLPPQENTEDDKKPEIQKKDLEDDIDSCLAQEVESIKAELKKSPDMRRFQAVESGANGIVFIRSPLPDPVKLAHDIATTVSNTGQKSKFLLRLLPVEAVCKAYVEEISQTCEKLFDKYFSTDEKTFAIVYNHRNNDSIKRDDLIETIAALVTKKNEKHKADLKKPDLAILLEVIRNICCISVVPEYFTLKKYNLLELSGKTETDDQKADGEVAEKRSKDDEGIGDGQVEPSEKKDESVRDDVKAEKESRERKDDESVKVEEKLD